MISYIMRSLLLIFVCVIVNSQGRTLTEQRHQHATMIRLPPSPATAAVDYNRRPELPLRNPPLIEMIVTSSKEYNFFWMMKNYGRKEHTLPPPSHKEAPPTHLDTGGGGSSAGWVESKILKLKNYGKEEHKTPPSPKVAPPTREVTGGGVVALECYGKEGGGLPPPTPHYAPPTHEVSGGGAAAFEQ